MLWDIAGAEDEFTVPTAFIRGAAGYLVVIDGTRSETLERGLEWVSQVEASLGQIPFIALLNKSDLTDHWQLQDEQLAPLLARGCDVIRCSAMSGEGVDEAFHTLTEQILALG